MRKIVAVLVLMTLSIFSAGCARQFLVHVNSYTDYTETSRLAAGSSVFVIENQNASNSLLEKEVVGKVRRLLEKKGYPSATFEAADYYALLGYGIGQGRDLTGTVPIYTPGGTAKVNTQGSYGYSSTSTIRLPDTVQYKSYQVSQYDRWLRILLVDAKDYRETGKVNLRWVGEIASTGTSEDLRLVINYMLVPAIDIFGTNTGKEVRVIIREDDIRVTEILN